MPAPPAARYPLRFSLPDKIPTRPNPNKQTRDNDVVENEPYGGRVHPRWWVWFGVCGADQGERVGGGDEGEDEGTGEGWVGHGGAGGGLGIMWCGSFVVG
jgi:hypothetical protein